MEEQTKRQIRHKYYNSRTWRKLRPIKMANNPLCEDCLKEGRITPAEEVHHIESPFKYKDYRRDLLFADYSNLVSLCKECHIKRHNNEQRKIDFLLDKYKD